MRVEDYIFIVVWIVWIGGFLFMLGKAVGGEVESVMRRRREKRSERRRSS